ncbi:MAG TPA: DNA ligase D [Acidisoma sp.]|uniref:DNA ligase D n=1 Tax=Acidisoma sp. TaxID=1872115 RepID=UPI002CA3AAA1|nr:DNA ligase D [Acidisoma sp.]HTI03628.1 DNA ligase D [Acidisoma sp.]
MRRTTSSLDRYHEKRRFSDTPEPRGTRRRRKAGALRFLVQKHDATRLHYDFRLELDGVLLSWAVTKGPSLDPADKRLAVRTEDHPLEYGDFEGIIPKGNYGAGTVMLWDSGTWEPIGDPHEELEKGKIAFNLHGEKMRGRWALVLMRKASEKRENWLLIKERDEEASETRDLIDEMPDSVASGRDLAAIAAEGGIWRSAPEGGADAKKARAANPHKRPGFVAPELATLVAAPPQGQDWLFEVKFDGYRIEIAASGEDVRAYSRSGLDWTERFPRLVAAAKSLDLDGALIDGEAVVMDAEGRSDFGLLQHALESGKGEIAYMAFDLLHEGGKDWRPRPLAERKARLQALLAPAEKDGVLRYSDHIAADGGALLAMARDKELEGIMAKRADRPYRSGRSEAWVKIKVAQAQEFVILGYRPSEKKRAFSSLLLGLQEEGGLRYVGRVGSGFSAETLDRLAEEFRRLAASKPAALDIPHDVLREAKWVKPELVVEIAFGGWTRDKLIRQGRFMGVREDKPAKEVTREEPAPKTRRSKPKEREGDDSALGVILTHPDKVLFPDCGVTKRDLAAYLAAAAPHLMPYAADRFVSLVRCPDGIEEDAFFQRHPGRGMDPSWHHAPVRTTHGSEEYLYFTEARALPAAAQLSVIEFHIWGSDRAHLEQPDRIVFDLDPDEGLPFTRVKDAAFLMRDVLEALGLRSLPLLSGGKGIHVVVPIQPDHDWQSVKEFAGELSRRVAADKPDLYVATMSKAKRKGRIFIDHFRNERGATAIAPFSPRARPGAPVAWPVSWAELSRMKAANVVRLQDAAAMLNEPSAWRGEAGEPQRLTAAVLAAVGIEP